MIAIACSPLPTLRQTAVAAARRLRQRLLQLRGSLRHPFQRILRLLSRLASRRRSDTLHVTALGWRAMAWTAGSLMLFAVCGWHEMLAVSATTATMMLCAWNSSRQPSRMSVTLTPVSSRVTAGDIVMIAVQTRNDGSSPTPALSLHVPIGSIQRTLRVPPLAPQASHAGAVSVPTRTRAILRIGPAFVSAEDPLGLLRRQCCVSPSMRVYVHPPIVPADSLTHGLQGFDGRIAERDAAEGLEFNDLREAPEPADARRVHWPSSARTGTLMVRRYDEKRCGDLLLALASDRRWYADDEEFELAVSTYASLGAQWLHDGHALIAAQMPRIADRATALRHARGARYDGPLQRIPFLDACCGIALTDGQPPDNQPPDSSPSDSASAVRGPGYDAVHGSAAKALKVRRGRMRSTAMPSGTLAACIDGSTPVQSALVIGSAASDADLQRLQFAQSHEGSSPMLAIRVTRNATRMLHRRDGIVVAVLPRLQDLPHVLGALP